jgi:hypothetical protein
MKNGIARILLLAVCATAVASAVAAHSAQRSETVMLTLQPRPGVENDLAHALADHWSAVRKLDLVKPDLHVTLRARDDSGQPYFVEIFTWRDADTPDNAPAEITAIWDRLNMLTAARGGRPGLDIKQVTLVTP